MILKSFLLTFALVSCLSFSVRAADTGSILIRNVTIHPLT